jgi:hypothetical protein
VLPLLLEPPLLELPEELLLVPELLELPLPELEPPTLPAPPCALPPNEFVPD